MPRITVHMFGIMFFDLCEVGKGTVIVPDGRMGDEHIPPHYASLFVEHTQLACKTDWKWPVFEHEFPIVTLRNEILTVPVYEFRIPTFTQIIFPADETPGATFNDLSQALVHMSDIDPKFSPDLHNQKNMTIATIPITSGSLNAFTFNRNLNAVQWSIRSGNNPLRIQAGGNFFTLKSRCHSQFGAEVVFTNAPAPLSAWLPGGNLTHHEAHAHGSGGHSDHASDVHHFSLFNKIDLNNGTPKFPAHRGPIQYNTAVMSTFQDVNYQSSCTPPCCRIVKKSGMRDDC